MILFRIRPEGSPHAMEGVSAEEILEGLKENVWEPTDEVMGPDDADWVALDKHPVFAKAMEDFDPPPPRPPEDETRLDMNPLIDVALVLLIFFIITTTYEELRKEFNPPPAERQEQKGRKTDADLKKVAIRVAASLENDVVVFRVEGDVVSERELEAKFKELMAATGHDRLAMEIDPQVPWKSVVAIQDAAAGAKFQQIIRVVRVRRE